MDKDISGPAQDANPLAYNLTLSAPEAALLIPSVVIEFTPIYGVENFNHGFGLS